MPDTIPYQPKLSRVVTVPDLPEMFYSQQEDLNNVIFLGLISSEIHLSVA